MKYEILLVKEIEVKVRIKIKHKIIFTKDDDTNIQFGIRYFIQTLIKNNICTIRFE